VDRRNLTFPRIRSIFPIFVSLFSSLLLLLLISSLLNLSILIINTYTPVNHTTILFHLLTFPFSLPLFDLFDPNLHLTSIQPELRHLASITLCDSFSWALSLTLL